MMIEFRKRISNKVYAFRCSACKNYFIWRSCIDVFLDSCTGVLIQFRCILAHAVNTAVYVCVLPGVIFYDRIDYLFRLLRGGPVIEIDQWLSVNRSGKNGEIPEIGRASCRERV